MSYQDQLLQVSYHDISIREHTRKAKRKNRLRWFACSSCDRDLIVIRYKRQFRGPVKKRVGVAEHFRSSTPEEAA